MFRRIKQLLCFHDWDCGWSRRCNGEHTCYRCGKTTKRVTPQDSPATAG